MQQPVQPPHQEAWTGTPGSAKHCGDGMLSITLTLKQRGQTVADSKAGPQSWHRAGEQEQDRGTRRLAVGEGLSNPPETLLNHRLPWALVLHSSAAQLGPACCHSGQTPAAQPSWHSKQPLGQNSWTGWKGIMAKTCAESPWAPAGRRRLKLGQVLAPGSSHWAAQDIGLMNTAGVSKGYTHPTHIFNVCLF